LDVFAAVACEPSWPAVVFPVMFVVGMFATLCGRQPAAKEDKGRRGHGLGPAERKEHEERRADVLADLRIHSVSGPLHGQCRTHHRDDVCKTDEQTAGARNGSSTHGS
jgi:hypothetical protein